MRGAAYFASAAVIVVLMGLGAQAVQDRALRRQARQRMNALHTRYLEKLDEGYDLSAVNALARPLTAGLAWKNPRRALQVIERVEQALARVSRKTGIQRIESIGPLGKPQVYDYRPAAAVASDGTWWLAWVAWKNKEGERLFIVHGRPGQWSEPVELSDGPGDYLRPSVVIDRSGHPWVFYATRVDGDVEVCYRRFDGTRWTRQQVIAPNRGPDFNIEAALSPDGRIVAVWQTWRDDNYDIAMAVADGAKIGRARIVSTSNFNDWDPVVAFGKRRGWVVWSGFNGTDYDLYAREVSGGRVGKVQRLTRNPAYDLHPWAAVDHDENLWVAWDNIYIPGHGGSGGTAYQRPKPVYAGRKLSCRICAVRFASDGAKTVPRPKRPGAKEKAASPDLGLAHPTVSVEHCGLPRIVFDRDGRLWLAYHYLQKMYFTYRDYWFPVLLACFDGQRWTTWRPDNTDGYLEEVSLVALPDGRVGLAWQTDYRRRIMEGEMKVGYSPTEEQLRRHFGEAFWNTISGPADIFCTVAQAPGRPQQFALISGPQLKPDAKPTPPRAYKAKKRWAINYRGQRLLVAWGDLHRHSNISRCSVGSEPTILDHWHYAHDICVYDFLAMTDHSEHTSDWQWWHINQIADLHYVPGKFVTLFGFEWTSGRYGHKNVIYPKRGEPIFSSRVKGSDTPEGLWKCLAGHRALTIPHHPADANMATDWRFHNDQYQRLVEIFQACRASYEYDGCPRQHRNATRKGCFVQDALNLGHKLGIIASTDHGYGASYAAVFTPELTREAIFDGLWNRRTYGSTAKGIFVDFRCNGHLMGEELQADQPPTFSGRAVGLTELAEVVIFKNGKVVYRHPSKTAAVKPGWVRGWLHLEWGPGQQKWSGRLTLSSGRIIDALFFSPDSAGEEVVREGPRRLSWNSVTSNGTDGVDMLIEAPRSAVVNLHTAAKDVQFRVGDAWRREQRWSVDKEGNYILARKRLAGTTLGTTSVSFTWTDRQLDPGTSWYYMRVIQTDGEMAWSSPIWVTRGG